MASQNGRTHGSRREFLRKAVPAGAVCAGCPGLLKLDLLNETQEGGQEVHKFLRDSGMTNQRVFDFVYTQTLIPMLRGLGEGTDREEYLERLKEVASRNVTEAVRSMEAVFPEKELATFTARLRDPNSSMGGVITAEVVEFSEDVCELKVTECLWADTFRRNDAAGIGYAAICYADYASITAFNPEFEMVRDKTLMQGHDCCNHRYQRKA